MQENKVEYATGYIHDSKRKPWALLSAWSRDILNFRSASDLILYEIANQRARKLGNRGN